MPVPATYVGVQGVRLVLKHNLERVLVCLDNLQLGQRALRLDHLPRGRVSALVPPPHTEKKSAHCHV